MLLLDEELRCQPWSQCSVGLVRGDFDGVVLVDGRFKDKQKVRKSSEKVYNRARITNVLHYLCSGLHPYRANSVHSPLSGKFDFWEAFLTVSIFLFVLCSVFSSARTAGTVLLVNLDFFFLVASTFPAVWKRGGEGRISRFVIFPSDARSSSWKVGLSFYSDASSLCGSVAPVRRREDTERDRDSGVKGQIDLIEGVLSRMPSEPFWNNSKGRQEETLASGGGGGESRR